MSIWRRTYSNCENAKNVCLLAKGTVHEVSVNFLNRPSFNIESSIRHRPHSFCENSQNGCLLSIERGDNNSDFVHVYSLRNSYTMDCPPVRGDNPRALEVDYLAYRGTNMV